MLQQAGLRSSMNFALVKARGDQLRLNRDLAALCPANERVHDEPPDLRARNVGGGQRRRGILGERDVVETGHGDVARNGESVRAQLPQHADRHHVVHAGDRRRPEIRGENLPHRVLAAGKPVLVGHRNHLHARPSSRVTAKTPAGRVERAKARWCPTNAMRRWPSVRIRRSAAFRRDSLRGCSSPA